LRDQHARLRSAAPCTRRGECAAVRRGSRPSTPRWNSGPRTDTEVPAPASLKAGVARPPRVGHGCWSGVATGQRASRFGQGRQPPSSPTPSRVRRPVVGPDVVGGRARVAKDPRHATSIRKGALAAGARLDWAGPRGPTRSLADSDGARSSKAPPPCHGTRDGMQSMTEAPIRRHVAPRMSPSTVPELSHPTIALGGGESQVSNVPPALRVDDKARRSAATADLPLTTRVRQAGGLHVGHAKPSIRQAFPGCPRRFHPGRAKPGRRPAGLSPGQSDNPRQTPVIAPALSSGA
jgi:hypothetical protein